MMMVVVLLLLLLCSLVRPLLHPSPHSMPTITTAIAVATTTIALVALLFLLVLLVPLVLLELASPHIGVCTTTLQQLRVLSRLDNLTALCVGEREGRERDGCSGRGGGSQKGCKAAQRNK